MVDPCRTSLERFTHASEAEVKTLIMKSPSKSCSLDPMPTWLLKLCVGELLHIITAMVNVSMDSGRVVPAIKCAQIIPLLKKLEGSRFSVEAKVRSDNAWDELLSPRHPD